MKILKGKAVVITGSGRGIGAACARAVARQGALVVINDIDGEPADETVDAIRAEGGTAVACVADVTQWEEAGKLIEACVRAFGRIDGLVNNAGVLDRGRIDQFDPVTARWMFDVHVMATLYCTAHAVTPMLAQGSGSIVNVTSGTHMGVPGYGVYGAAKGATASLVYTWSMELAGSGVRVNGLSPFAATTIGLRNPGTDFDEKEAERLKQVLPPPEENAPVVEYLLSDLSKLNGQIIRIERQEVCLFAHPALLLPTVKRESWTAQDLAELFDNQFKDRLVPCGFMGTDKLPVTVHNGPPAELQSAGKQ